MTSHGYPYTGYGVEAHTDNMGWVLLEDIHRTRADAAKFRQSITGQHGFRDDELRIAVLTITRKEDIE